MKEQSKQPYTEEDKRYTEEVIEKLTDLCQADDFRYEIHFDRYEEFGEVKIEVYPVECIYSRTIAYPIRTNMRDKVNEITEDIKTAIYVHDSDKRNL